MCLDFEYSAEDFLIDFLSVKLIAIEFHGKLAKQELLKCYIIYCIYLVFFHKDLPCCYRLAVHELTY